MTDLQDENRFGCVSHIKYLKQKWHLHKWYILKRSESGRLSWESLLIYLKFNCESSYKKMYKEVTVRQDVAAVANRCCGQWVWIIWLKFIPLLCLLKGNKSQKLFMTKETVNQQEFLYIVWKFNAFLFWL